MIGVLPTAERMMNRAPSAKPMVVIERLMRNTRAADRVALGYRRVRRLLLQPNHYPRNVNGADFAAERAWLLLRMGESVGARAMVAIGRPAGLYAQLYQVAMQAALGDRRRRGDVSLLRE